MWSPAIAAFAIGTPGIAAMELGPASIQSDAANSVHANSRVPTS
jgi:hypothetical protein